MFNWNIKTHNYQPIGLDIGHDSVKIIQLAVNNGSSSVIAAEKIQIDSEAAGDTEKRNELIVAAIKQILAGGNFQGKRVVSCVPNDKIHITSFRLAEGVVGSMDEVLYKEATHRFGSDIDTDDIQYLRAGSIQHGDEVKNECILFAADAGAVKEHIDLLEQAKLELVAIDTVPCALYRCFERGRRREEDREQTVVFIDIGSRFTTVVFGRSGQINFIKRIEAGGEKFDRQIAAKLGIAVRDVKVLRAKLRNSRHKNTGLNSEQGGESVIDERTRRVIIDTISNVAEELAKEISLCLRYYTVTFRGKRIERVIFSGGEAQENILINIFKQQLPVEIEIGQPLIQPA